MSDGLETEASTGAVPARRVAGAAPRRESGGVRRHAGPALAFIAAAALVTAYALDGGTFDIVRRHEFGLVLWWILTLGLLLGVLPRRSLGPLTALAPVTLLALACWTAISLGWTDSQERTFTEFARVVHHLGVLLLVAFLVDRTTWRPVVAGATAGAVLVCMLALASRVSPGDFGSEAVARSFGFRRLAYPLNYWNAVGSLASMAALLCLAFSAHARSTVLRLVAVAAAPLAITVAYLTYSRAAVGGGVLALVVLFALSRNRWTLVLNAIGVAVGSLVAVAAVRGAPQIADGTGADGAGVVVAAVLAGGVIAAAVAFLSANVGVDRVRLGRRAGRTAAIGVAAVAVVAAGGLGAAYGGEAWDQFTTYSTETRSSDPAARLTNLRGSRYILWETSWDTFREEPLRGSGAGTFEFRYNARSRGDFVMDGHSLFVEPLGELGLPGALLMLAFVGAGGVLVGAARRRSRGAGEIGAVAGIAAALTVYVLAAAVDWLWESTAIAAFALVLLGAAAGATARGRPSFRLPFRAVAVLVAVVGCLVFLPGLVSTSAVRASQEAVRDEQLPTALADARDAIEAQPWSATAYLQHGLVAERLGDLRVARGSLREAIAVEPRNWRHHLLLARIEAERGRPAAAVRAYERARTLRPNAAIFKQLSARRGR